MLLRFFRGSYKILVSTKLVINTSFNLINYSDSYISKNYSNSLSNLVNSSYFLKKVWSTKKVFYYQTFNFQKAFGSVHFLIKFIKSWDVNICFFLTSRIVCPFSQLNFNRLRNVFIKGFREHKLWLEIEKMFNLGLLSMSSNSIYWGEIYFLLVFCHVFYLKFI